MMLDDFLQKLGLDFLVLLQISGWTLVFSVVTLKGIIPTPDLQCWQLFVSACSILCSKLISKGDVDLADQYLLMFCRKFQALYGPESCTPSKHLHLHLKDCVLDYGPVYSFWLFAFERFNGILGAYNTNNRNIEVQIMREFLRHQQATKMEIPSDFPQFTTILKTSKQDHSIRQCVMERHFWSSNDFQLHRYQLFHHLRCRIL